MKFKNCEKCGKKFECKSLKAKWCSLKCGSRNAYAKTGMEKECKFCKSIFYGHKNKKFCSGKCIGNYRSDHLNKIHNARRKYPKIEGLNRCQIFRKFNPKKNREELEKDIFKRGILIHALGGKCKICSYDNDLRALQLDHINNDGKEDRKRIGNRISRYYLKNMGEAKEKIQVLCANCHAIKTWEKQREKF